MILEDHAAVGMSAKISKINWHGFIAFERRVRQAFIQAAAEFSNLARMMFLEFT